MALTQMLGTAAYNLQSIEALKVPSARTPKTYNLVVFVNRLSDNSSLRVDDDSGIIDAQLPFIRVCLSRYGTVNEISLSTSMSGWYFKNDAA